MARPLRIQLEGAIYHITSRGNEKSKIFQDANDRATFLNILKDAIENFNWICHAYCLMNNHYHLVIETPEGNLSKGMKHLNATYAQKHNKRHERVGHLFEGRYKAILIEKQSQLLRVIRYVVLNPVRAKSVRLPEEWKWSSYRATAGCEKPHECLTVDWILSQFGKERHLAIKRYVTFVLAGIHEESIWKNLKGGVFLGSEEFVEKFSELVKEKGDIKDIPRTQRYVTRPTLEKIFTPSVLNNKDKRNKKIYEAIKKYGYFQSEVGRFLNKRPSTVSKIFRREERRFKNV